MSEITNRFAVSRITESGSVEYLTADGVGATRFEEVESTHPYVVWLAFEAAQAIAEAYKRSDMLNPARPTYLAVMDLPTVNDEPPDDYYDDGMSDAEADADTLRSAGWGTDEDYGYYDEHEGW